MDFIDMVEIGEKIVVTKRGDSSRRYEGFSMVQDKTEKGNLVLTLPTFGGRPVLFNPGDEVSILYFREEGGYSFEGVIEGKFRVHRMVVFDVRPTSTVKRIQRRNFYRLKTNLLVEYWVLTKEETEPKRQKAYCIDISGSGLRLVSDYRLSTNAIVKCDIYLSKRKKILIEAKVVRVEASKNIKGKYDIGLSFYKINNRTRDVLVKHIFEKQRELRSKGLI